MSNIDVMQVKSPTTKIIGIFASMAAIVALSTVSMNGTTLASTDAKYFIQRDSHILKNNRIVGSVSYLFYMYDGCRG